MPRLVNRTPRYRKHKGSGLAVVYIDGREIYLGPHGTATSKRVYDRVVAEWLANGRRAPLDPADDLAVVELIARYWGFAEQYHKPAPGSSDGELDGIRAAIRIVKRLYADTPVSRFGPLSLRAVRDAMVALGWCRSYTNAQVNRVRRMFKWGVEREMVPPSILHGLQAVVGLREGKCEARETQPVVAVEDAVVEATLPFPSRQVQTMVKLQLLTGMRAGEVVLIRTGDIDRTARPDGLWTFRPFTHKNSHRGHDRVVPLGPKARELLSPFLKMDPEAFIFSPAEADAERRVAASAARKTPASCGNAPGTNRARRPKRKPGDRYSVDAYRRAIARACARAFPAPAPFGRSEGETDKAWRARLTPGLRKALAEWQDSHRWSPLQLRHSAATRLRRTHGLEAAQVLLGHRTIQVTQRYAQQNLEAAERVMAAAG